MTIRLRYVGHKSNRMLGEAIKRAGGALHAASNDFNQSLALITAGNTNIQDPQSVSQLLKTMSMRLRGASAKDLQELGIDTEGMTDGKKSIVQLYKSMAGIDIMEGTNYKSTYQILDELYEKWDSLNDAQHAAISEMTGGKRAGSVFASLMTNWEDARKVVEAAERGMTEHSAQKELENASRSVQFSLNQLKSTWQELAYDFINSGALKSTIDLFTKLVDVVDKAVKSTGDLIPTVAGLAAVFYGLASINGLIKTFANVTKLLEKATGEKQRSIISDTIETVKATIAEKLHAQAIRDTTKATQEVTAATKNRTGAQIVDINTKEVVDAGAAAGAGGEGAAAGLSAAGFAAGVAVVALAAFATTAYLVYQRNEALKDSALELSSSFKNSAKEVDGYKEKIAGLYDTINDSSTSYEDAKAARQELLGVQDELITKYGNEAENINIVTQAINGQVDALDALKDKQWQQTKNKFNDSEGINVFTDWINQWVHGANDNIGVMEKEMFNAKIHISGFSFDDKEFLRQMEETFGGEYIVDANAGTLTFSGDLDDIKEKLYAIQRIADDIDVSASLKESLTKQINAVDDTISKYQEMANQWTLNEDILPNDAYRDFYQQMIDAHEEYQSKVVEGDEEAANTAKENFIKVLDTINEALASDENKDQIMRYFEGMYPELQSEIGKWKLETTISAKIELGEDEKREIYNRLGDLSVNGYVDLTQRKQAAEKAETFTDSNGTVAINFTPVLPDGSVLSSEELKAYADGVIAGTRTDDQKLQIGAEFTGKDAVQQAQSALNKARVLQDEYFTGLRNQTADAVTNIQAFDNEYQLLNYHRGEGTEEQDEAWDRIQASITRAKSSLEDYIAVARESKGLENFAYNDASRATSGIGKAWQGAGGLKFAEANQNPMTEAINSLAKEEFDDLMSMGDVGLQKLGQRAQELAREMGTVSLPTETWITLLQSALKEFQELKESTEEVSEVEFNLDGFAEATKKLKEIQTLYDKFAEQKKESKENPLFDAEDLSGLDDAIKSLDGFTDFYQTLTSGNATVAEVQTAFDNLATEYIYTSDVLSGLNEENRDFYVSQLELKGIANANEIVTRGLAEAYGTAAKMGIDLSNATEADIVALSNEQSMSAEAKLALEELAYAKLQAALQQIDESSNIAQLEALARAAGLAGSALTAISGMSNSIKMLDKLQKSGANAATIEGQKAVIEYEQRKALDNAQRNWERKLANVGKQSSVSMGGSGAGGSKSGGGGGGGGSAKDTKEQTDALKELSSQLDEIQSAYSSLSEIVKSYNENGKLTIDQAQELINTDFRYLAMLTDEGGQLRLNEQGFQDLAKAKLQEMQVQLALNAIDAVNNLKTEADAVNFLTYAYEGLAGKTLEAAEAQLQFAVAAAHARGAKQGEAADKMYQGYLATKQAIGNVDLGSGSLAGKKDEGKDKTDKDKKTEEKAQQDTKTKWNWLDRLVSKIQRTIDQFAKKAEKYFDYQQKNAMVDKQIEANHRLITTQELSVSYYQNKTNKALKKVPKKYRDLVSGNFDPTTVKKLVTELGSGKTQKLQDYLDWQELLEKSQDSLADAYDQERSLITSKLDNILDYFDTLIDYQQNIVDGIESSRQLDTAKGLQTDFNKLMSQYAAQKDIVDKSGDREAAYRQAAAAANSALSQSYQSQINNVSNAYKNTVDYNKKKNRKNKAVIDGYEVLEEDITEAEAAAKLYRKKNASKHAQGQAILERLHKKYTDYLAELQREEAAATATNNAKMADQIQQNKTATQQAAESMWNIMFEILDEMGKVYDNHINNLNVIIGRYSTIADLLKDMDKSVIADYGVADLFEITTYGDSTRTNALGKVIQNTKDMILQYKEQYNLYQDLINAVESSDAGTRQQRLLEILNRNNLSAASQVTAKNIAQQLAGNDWNGNTYLTQWKDNLSSIISAIADAIKQAEDYGDELAASVTETTQRLIDSLRLLQEAYAAKASLINDNWVTDINGLTDYGYAKISALSQEIDIARKRADLYRQQISDISANRDNYSTEEDYNEAYNTAVKNYYDALSDAYSAQNEVYELAKKIATAEVDNLSKLVDNYKKALNAKKAYYDYDKQLRDKNKNIQNLRAEQAALSGVGDAASKARLKALDAELKEAQEDLDDTVFEHSIQVESDALDKLIEDMTNALNDSTKTIQQTFEDFAKTVSSVMEAAGKADTGSIYDKVINFIMTGFTAGKYYDNGIDTTEGTVSHTTTTSDTSSTTVADELENGSLVPVTLGNTLTGIDSHLLSVLAQVTDSQKLQTTMANNMNYLPNISAKVDSIASGVGSIASNTSTIAGQLSNIQNALSKNRYGGKYLNLNSLSSYQLNQLRKLGITRIYY